MGLLTGTDIIERVTDTLQDKDNIRWPRLELLRYINDAQREIVLKRPDSSAKTTAMSVTSGQTRQVLPADGARLIEVVRNMGGDGVTAGKAVRLTAREVLDSQVPNWHVTPSGSVATHYVFDIRNPKTFYLYPKPASAYFIELVYSAAPVNLPAESGTISLDDIYANAIIAYVLMRAYQKDEDFARNADMAGFWAQAFMVGIDARTQADGAVNPNNNLGTDKSR